MIEPNGDILCLMGRMCRIADALTYVELKPKNILEKEIGTKCYTLYKKMSDDEKNSENLS